MEVLVPGTFPWVISLSRYASVKDTVSQEAEMGEMNLREGRTFATQGGC